ncbi:hypothetical protein Q3G72_020499 [Acer saccharum]|nr:hypothetical protein Q3G72_020499 [Acer saccharum]
MGAVRLDVVARIDRENCSRTKHDPCFSKWQVLVGPSDWEDHSLGKEGVARYRVHNLPTVPVPDFMSLCYGRSGAHLNNPNHCGLKSEPGHFEDIFSRGYPIVYRWAPMKSKADALKVETQLLDRFDYAWNKGSNVRHHHDDVLRKLDKVPSRNIQFPRFIRKIIRFSQKPMGIEIKETKQLSLEQKFSNYADEKSNNFFPQGFKFSKSQPKLVLDRQGAEDRTLNYNKKNSPEMYKAGRVVSSERSDEKVNTPVYGEDSNSSTFDDRKYGSSVCGARTLGGSYCTRPVKGNTSCWQHSVQISDSRDSTISSSNVSEYGGASLCGASTQNGSYCSRLVKGGGSCWQHSVHAQVNGGPGLLPSLHVSYRDSSISSRTDWKCEGTSPCGASTRNGSRCRRQVKGGGRCWQH